MCGSGLEEHDGVINCEVVEVRCGDISCFDPQDIFMLQHTRVDQEHAGAPYLHLPSLGSGGHSASDQLAINFDRVLIRDTHEVLGIAVRIGKRQELLRASVLELEYRALRG